MNQTRSFFATAGQEGFDGGVLRLSYRHKFNRVEIPGDWKVLKNNCGHWTGGVVEFEGDGRPLRFFRSSIPIR